MLGLQMKLNGMIAMVMVVEIIRVEPLLMSVQMFLEHPLAQHKVVTAGVAQIQMVMDGPTKEINSSTSHHSGVMKMVMGSEIIQMVMKEMHVQMNVVNHSSID
jgi:hypothetical protein